MTPADHADAANQAAAQATCAAAFVDQLAALGVRHAVVAPGSRSTPVALALAARAEIALHVVHDERVAGFVALGLGLSGTPAVLLCTSGTAAANFLPAIVEAGASEVPMLVLTADRPPELRDVGAPQAIDQTHLYGRAVRWFHDPGVPVAGDAPVWQSLAARAHEAAASGPVHLNLPFREPLVGTPGPLPPRRRVAVGGLHPAPMSPPGPVVDLLRRPRGLVLAGDGARRWLAPLAELVEATGWPLLADPVSGARSIAGAVTSFDALLRHQPFAAEHPDVVIRVGRPATSKVLASWVVTSGAPVVQVGGPGVVDPDHSVAATLPPATLAPLRRALARAGDPAWRQRWVDADRRAEAAIERELGPEAPLGEPGVARLVARHLPADAELVVAASMPMRDLEWFGGRPARAHANRGANGIDGVLSTALGVALDGTPTVVLVGDIAFVHDAGALTALARRDADLRIVVVDNDGGGIFSFLPQAALLPAERFEQLFATPHGTDIVALAAAQGLDASTVVHAAELVARITTPGPSVTRVATDRAANVAAHHALNAAVAAALD